MRRTIATCQLHFKHDSYADPMMAGVYRQRLMPLAHGLTPNKQVVQVRRRTRMAPCAELLLPTPATR